MQDSILADNKIIEERKLHKQQALLVLGSLEAEDDVCKVQQMKIRVISQQESAQTQTKGADTMKKHCYKRKDGRWEYYKQQNGLVYRAIAPSYRELLEKIQKIKPKLKKQVKNIRNIKTMSFASYWDLFTQTYITANKYEWEKNSRLYIHPNFSRVPLDKLTAEECQLFINGITKERLREKLFQQTCRVLRKAYITKKIKEDLALALEKPKRENVQERTPLTLEEQAAFIAELKKRSKKMYVFGMFSLIVGSRREETCNFNIKQDLNEERQIIHIRGTKTKNANRKVYVSKAFIEFLKENMEGETIGLTKYSATNMFEDVFRTLHQDKCLHCLRHTCSANLMFLGAKDKFRQLQLGHASITTTNDIYTNINDFIAKSKLLEIYGDLYPRFDETFDETFFT